MRSFESFRGPFIAICAGAAVLTLSACATAPENDPEALAAFEATNDPLEPMNRYFFEVNYALDEIVLKPVAGWYYVALPNPVQDSVRNFLRNLSSPVILANDVFQGETDRAGTTLIRFLVNSTFGIVGLFDVASEMGFQYHDEDFGQTLAVHGVDEGPYLVLPIIGPSNPRDAAGRIVDVFLDPLTYIAGTDGLEDLPYVRSGVTAVDTRARNLKTLDEIREGSLDYYATIRSLYRQKRNDAIRNGEASAESYELTREGEADRQQASGTH